MWISWSWSEKSTVQNLGKASLQKSCVIGTCFQGKVYQIPLQKEASELLTSLLLVGGERCWLLNAWTPEAFSWSHPYTETERPKVHDIPEWGRRGAWMLWGRWVMGHSHAMCQRTQEWVNFEARLKARAQHKCIHLFKLKLPITLLFPCIWFFFGRWQEIAGR